jgi:O-antigen ligase
VVVAVVALAAHHAATATPWVDLLGLLAWGAILALVIPLPEEGARRAALHEGVMLGGLALVAVQSTVAGVDAIAWLAGAAGRVAGTTAHANVLASSMLLAAAALALLADRERGSRRRLAIVGLSLALALALASGSRAAVLGAAAGGAIWALSTLVGPAGGPEGASPAARRGGRGRRRMAWAVLAITVFAPLTIASVRGFPIEDLLQREVERSAVFATALDIIAERPVLGHGGVPWAELMERVEPALPVGAFAHAHSVPLHVAARGGAAALLLAVLLAVGSYRVMRPHLAIVLSRPGIGPPVLAAATASVAVQGAVDLVIINPAVYLVAAALVGTVTVVARGYHPDA